MVYLCVCYGLAWMLVALYIYWLGRKISELERGE